MDPYVGRIIPLVIMCGTALTALTLVLIASARRARRDVSTVPDEVKLRLERIEQAVDTIAIEVERISEGQRFTSKLLADREAPRAPLRQITPH